MEPSDPHPRDPTREQPLLLIGWRLDYERLGIARADSANRIIERGGGILPQRTITLLFAFRQHQPKLLHFPFDNAAFIDQ